MSEVQTIKTLIHEITHSLLDDRDINAAKGIEQKSRNDSECIAESVAFTVCQHFGIDTSDYSLGYIASWSEGKDTKELKASMEEIRTEYNYHNMEHLLTNTYDIFCYKV